MEQGMHYTTTGTGEMVGRLGSVDSAAFVIQELLKPLKKAEGVLAAVGLVVMTKVTYQLAKLLWTQGNVYLASKEKLPEVYGKYAVINGVGEELGKNYARALASMGMNLILVGEQQLELEELSKEIVSTSRGIKVRSFVYNVETGMRNLETLLQQVNRKDVGLLVNVIRRFTVNSERELNLEDMLAFSEAKKLELELGNTPYITSSVLEEMMGRGRGGILTIIPSSTVGLKPSIQTRALKKYLEEFMKATEEDSNSKGSKIKFLTLFPGEFCHKKSFIFPNSADYAKNSLILLGHTSSSSGHWSFSLQKWISSLVPSYLASRLQIEHACLCIKH